MHSSLVVADHLLSLEQENPSRGLTPMKLIKLVYLCHGWMLGLYDRPLLDDRIEAWRYGPVIADLYHAVKHFRASPVTERLSKDNGEFDEDEKSVMRQSFSVYGKYTGIQLSIMTHASDTPWRLVWDAGRDVIPNDLIKKHFQKLWEQAQSA